MKCSCGNEGKKVVNDKSFCSRKCLNKEFADHLCRDLSLYLTPDSSKLIQAYSEYEVMRMRELDYLEQGVITWGRLETPITWVNSRGETQVATALWVKQEGPSFRYKRIEKIVGKVTNDAIIELKALKLAFKDNLSWEVKFFSYGDDAASKIETVSQSYENDYGVFMRPSLESVFMTMALSLASRSTCVRKKVGVVFTDMKMQQAYCIGYNGDHKGGNNQCDSLEPGMCGCIHAEINALTKNNTNIDGCLCFVTLSPCVVCAKVLINRNVKKIIYYEEYRNSSFDLLKNAGIEVVSYASLQSKSYI